MIAACPRCQLRYDVTGRPPGSQARCRCGATFPLPDPPADAVALLCPQCGGACAPTKTRCDFCAAELATVRCPRCFTLLFRGSKFCSLCGASSVAPALAAPEGQPSARTCPRCRPAGSPLVAELVGDVSIDRCDACSGLFIDQASFERIVDEREREVPSRLALAEPRPEPPAADPVSYRKCPDCDSLMNRRNFGGRSGVIVDVCQAHGTWFDPNELAHVIQFVRSGSLDEAYRREREELARLQGEERARRISTAVQALREPGEDRPWSLGMFTTLGFLARLFDVVK